MVAIHAGNTAAHHGNWRVDIILAKRGLLTPDNFSKFKFWFGNSSTKPKFPNLIIDMTDLNATMVSCLAGTAYTHDKVLQDSFAESYRVINDLYKDAVQKHPGDWQAAFNAISSNPRAQLLFAKIKGICVEFETKQSYGIHHRWMRKYQKAANYEARIQVTFAFDNTDDGLINDEDYGLFE